MFKRKANKKAAAEAAALRVEIAALREEKLSTARYLEEMNRKLEDEGLAPVGHLSSAGPDTEAIFGDPGRGSTVSLNGSKSVGAGDRGSVEGKMDTSPRRLGSGSSSVAGEGLATQVAKSRRVSEMAGMFAKPPLTTGDSSKDMAENKSKRGLKKDTSKRDLAGIAKLLMDHVKMDKKESLNQKDIKRAESESSMSSRNSDGSKTMNRTPSFLRKVLAHKSTRYAKTMFEDQDGVISLPRGGVYCNTSAGAVQFGMPPETVKDSMEMGIPVPTIFVVPPERFNLHEGVNVSEIEFPAFFNYFVLKKKIRLITYEDTVPDLKAIMQEALLGPTSEFLYVDHEYSKFVSDEVYAARANHEKEIDYFVKPRPPDFYQINIENLVDFEFFDEAGRVDLGDGTYLIDDGNEGYLLVDTEKRKELKESNDISDDFHDIAVGDALGAAIKERRALKHPGEVYITYEQGSSCLSVPPGMKQGPVASNVPNFEIPQFGLTVLGNSHGFDPDGSTSGFVVWVNGQGCMVDPPPHSSMLLTRAGIQPKSITAIILTHCHADHETGTIQKMVTEDKCTLMTTQTVFDSFLRKYEAVTGLGREFIKVLVNFRPVYLEEPTYWNGASFRFFYSLHSIPCVGFEVSFYDKSLVYSADTYYDPKGLTDMHEQGVLSKGRLEALLNFPWGADIVLHEMGVPPIHTPIEALEAIDEKYRKNMYLIHIGAKTARDAKKRGFNIATPGVENTLTLVRSTEKENKLLRFMQLISSMDLFRGFQVSQALELLFMAREAVYPVGSEIVKQGTPGDKFMIVVTGSASVTFGGAKKVFRSGDYLGEISVITGAVRTATVIAETPVIAMEVDKYAFDYLVMHDPRLKIRMENLIKSRSDGSWRAIANNSLLSTFSASQKTQLQALLTVRTLKKGDHIWNRGEPVHMGVLISKGGLRIEELSDDPGDESIPEEKCQLTVGMFIFDMLGVMNDANLTTTLVVQSNMAMFFTFDSETMMTYLDSNPLLLLGLLKSLVII